MVSGDVAVAQGHRGAFHETLRLLSQHWERIDVLCPRAAGSAPRVLHENVFVHPAPGHRALQALFVRRQGAALAAERAYDLIVSHDYGVFYNGVGAWLLSRRTGIPFVSEIHHVEGYPRAATTRERLYRGLARLYIRWVWRRAVAIRTVNATELPGLLRSLGVPSEKIVVLPSLYLDLAVFRPLPDAPKEIDVLLVGRLVPSKGIPTLLEALARVRQTRPEVRASILGNGPLKAALERRIAELDLTENVELLAQLESADDVARLYNRARVLVCASTAEGGPRVTAEAMACGVPVISTPVGVMPDLVRDSENGLLFQWDAAELAAELELLLADDGLRERLGEAGRESVQGFDAASMTAELAACYRSLSGRGPSARPV
jgi:glycosyltransferase involved in cell wall biosynthesis